MTLQQPPSIAPRAAQDLVTVIVPCYQQGGYLPESIGSVQAQTHRNWEAIIVDDGSTDDTGAIALRLCAADARIRYLHKPNGGLSSARNAGLDAATGRWIQFLDADDLILPRKLERQLAAADGGGHDDRTLVYSGYFLGTHEQATRRAPIGQPSHRFRTHRPVLDMAMRWEHDLSIPIHAALFPAAVFAAAPVRFDESLPNHEDWDVWMQVLALVDQVLLVDDELAIYRVSPTSMSRDRPRMRQGFAAAIAKQRRLFGHDAEVVRALDYLAAMNEYSHGRSARGRLHELIDHGLLGNTPLRRYLWRLTVPPRPPLTGVVPWPPL